MEAVPRLPMISFEIKTSTEIVTFGQKLKPYIASFYNEDPESYNNEIHSLETLRAAAVRPSIDINGCQMLKKYYCQLHFLKSRFPMNDNQVCSVFFAWKDNYSKMVGSVPEIDYELMSILYDIGAVHSQLGAQDSRVNPEGMKMACTHFQCAAWAFQTLRENYLQMVSLVLAPEIVQFMYLTCLAQAQECILEKSMMDNRKATIIAKVAVQVVDYYKQALTALKSTVDDGCFSDLLSSNVCKDWHKYLNFKIAYHKCIALLYQGQQAEEQQKMGERVAFYQAAADQLNEACKLASKMNHHQQEISEALAFTGDVVEGKKKAAKNENEFIYHEDVPEKDALQEVKGASLVKGIAFSVNDHEVSGVDIFARLVPMEAHEASSLYSEEKAKILRQLGELVEMKDHTLAEFMSSLQLDVLTQMRQASGLTQDLVDRAAAMSAKPTAIQDLKEAMAKLSNTYHDVEAMLNEIDALLKEEEKKEQDYQTQMGKRPPSILATDLTREYTKYKEAHSKASDSNENLHRAMMTHIANLKVLALPLSQLKQQIPSIEFPNSEIDEDIIRELETLVGKVEEMKSQRTTLWTQLRDEMKNDDITGLVITKQPDKTIQQLFKEEINKHRKQAALIEQNMAAQENILKALVDTYARFANTRRYLQDTITKRAATLSALIGSFDTYDDLLAKANKGIEFYNKLETNVTKLLQRIKSTCKVQDEEREQMLAKHSKPITKGVEVTSTAPKLKDYLDKGVSRKALDTGGLSGVGKLPEQVWPPAVRPAPVGSEMTADDVYSSYAADKDSYSNYIFSTNSAQVYYNPTSFTTAASSLSNTSTAYTNGYHNYMYMQQQPQQQLGLHQQQPGLLQQQTEITQQPGFQQQQPGFQQQQTGLQQQYQPALQQQPGFQQLQIGSQQPQTALQQPQTALQQLQQRLQQLQPGFQQPQSGVQQPPPGFQQSQPGLQQSQTGLQQQPGLQQHQPQFSEKNLTEQELNDRMAALMSNRQSQDVSQQQNVISGQMYGYTGQYSNLQTYPTQNMYYATDPYMSQELATSQYINPATTASNIAGVPTSTIYNTDNYSYQMGSYVINPSVQQGSNAYTYVSNSQQVNDPAIYQSIQEASYGYDPIGIQSPNSYSQANGNTYMQTVPASYNYNQGLSTSTPTESPNYNYGQSNTQAIQSPYSYTQACNDSNTQSIPSSNNGYAQSSSVQDSLGYYNNTQMNDNMYADYSNYMAQYDTNQQSYGITYYQSSNIDNATSGQLPNYTAPTAVNQVTSTTNVSTSVTEVSKNKSNVDLLSGLDFTVNQVPLTPQQNKSDPVIKDGGSSTPKLLNDHQTTIKPTVLTPPQPNSCLTEKKVIHFHTEALQNPTNLRQLEQEVEKYEKFVDILNTKTLNGLTNLDMKWKEIQDKLELDQHKSISVARCYPMKNRYPDILPYDQTRIKLCTTKDDYINASIFENVSANSPTYIITQAPVNSTFVDFWTLVWEQQIELILCLLNDNEMGSDIYWPQQNKPMSFRAFSISLQTVNKTENWTDRIIRINHLEQRTSLTIRHMQFTTWPESIFPTSPAPTINYLNEILKDEKALSKPILIHCLAGIGRSGLFCFLLSAITEVFVNPLVLPDLTSIAINLLNTRKNVFRDREHLKFGYQAFLHFLKELCATCKCKQPTESVSSIEVISMPSSTSNIDTDPLSMLDPLWASKRNT